ncbi:MAG: DUF4405 domain-containing protein, partial [Planctomycetales bacterium]|nr:DUF4405 domain-containing protein [Planctomycetales bacterium]
MKNRKLTRTDVNFWLDFALLIVFLLLAWASIILRFVFPPAFQAEGWTLWGWTYERWADIQFTILGILALGLLIHVMLHWTWVCGVVASRVSQTKGSGRDDGSRTLWGV